MVSYERTYATGGHLSHVEEYSRATPHRLAGPEFAHPNAKENATLYTLCRNDDLQTLVETILSWEDRFNHQYHYDWIFINDEPFNQEFEEITSRLVSGRAFYAVIPPIHWSVPNHIDPDLMAQGMQQLADEGVQYADSIPYRHMCRYNSGLFYEHPLMKKYRYYWRVDGDTHMFCDIPFDVFTYMRENDYKYAFTLSMYENMKTIPHLWESTIKFAQAYPQLIAPNNLANFITDDEGRTYNGCHFWSNFEIADSELWRGEAYSRYFEFLDRVGGFFYERWGDAPVHSIAASLFIPKEQVAHLDFVGYWHPPLTHIPSNFLSRPDLRCGVNPARNFEWNDDYNCIQKYYDAQNMMDAVPSTMEAAYHADWSSGLKFEPEEEENEDHGGEEHDGEENDGEETRGDEDQGAETRGDENHGEETRGDEGQGEETRGDENHGEENRGDENHGDEYNGEYWGESRENEGYGGY